MGELIVPDTEPRVVCASCGRSRDMPPVEKPPAAACEVPGWHRPQPEVPDADVTAEDGDDLAPLTEDDLLAAVGPEPGKTWAELYAKAALQLSYRTAELRGAERELDRLRASGRQSAGAIAGDSAVVIAALIRRLADDDSGMAVRLTSAELGEATRDKRVSVFVVPATGELCLEVER